MASEKSPDAYRTISEAAEEADLPAHVLRFWESKFTQLKPLKRNGGRRLYRPQDIQLLKGLRQLLYEEGFTIKGAQKYLRDHGVAAVAELGKGGGSPFPDAPGVSETPDAAADAGSARPEAGADDEGAVPVGAAAPLDAAGRARLEHVLERLIGARDSLRQAIES